MLRSKFGFGVILNLAVMVSATFLSSNMLTAQEAVGPDLTGVKCVMNAKKEASADAAVEYKGGKVYFCCDHCADAFREDMKLKEKATYTTKANHQLVLTGQFVQKGCPMSGKAIAEGQEGTVGTIKVGFCCEHCTQKLNETEGMEAKAELVFAEKAFKNAYHKKPAEIKLADVKCMMMPKKDVVADQAVEYGGGKVFFCCGGCVKKFSAAPEKFAAQANHQLVATGQFVQTACPISGGDVDDEQSSVVGGETVSFCCERCKAKVDGAKSDAKKVELVFGAKRFEKSFTKQ